MRAGALRRRVTLQTRTTSVDTFGAQQQTWTDVATVWADVDPMSAAKQFLGNAVRSDITHQITLRYRPELAAPIDAAALRVVYGSRIFTITSVINEDERNRMVTLLAHEGLTRG